MSPSGAFYYDGGWNRKALIALAVAGTLSIGLALLGAYGAHLQCRRLGLADRRRCRRAVIPCPRRPADYENGAAR